VGAQAEAVARVVVQEGLAAHRLVATGDDDVGLPRLDGLRAGHDRLQARGAQPVDVHRRHLGREPGGERASARVVRVRPHLTDLSHHDLVDVVRLDTRAGDRLLDARGAKLVRVDVLQRAAEAADRRAYARDEHHRIAVVHHVIDGSRALRRPGAATRRPRAAARGP
jgi:hypothetical protein